MFIFVTPTVPLANLLLAKICKLWGKVQSSKVKAERKDQAFCA
jgi:hypothetical protein